ncbi:flagellar type III secretion system protein FliR [Brenneria izadpanahii]|uniref:Flagellar biosynthetic protein FliR n=1 Tax=Brenneria izadpanahii TaxID=2722756 RepID=A0ABX7UQQ4_9GAMM|nr:flagellar biosynthetic protein FliR [Brenneria izadpanahii]QTF07976.1 flagellar type III secretion system protein FliR [Brenneria izadpanahii]
MIEVTSADLTYWLGQYFWPFVRLLALIATAPLFNEKGIDSKVKIGLAFLCTVLISPQITIENTPIFSVPGVWLLIKQVLIGIALGFTMQLAFAVFRLAGEIIGLQMGLSFATFFDPSSGANTSVLSRFFNVFAMLLFLVFDGHLWLISLLADSFHLIPINQGLINSNIFLSIAQTGSLIFINGLMLALPLITFLLVINISLGVLNRMSPQLSVFVIGFPITLTIGILTIGLLMPLFAPFSEHIFSELFDVIAMIIREFLAQE